MWGTIARMQVKTDVPEEYLVAQLSALNTDHMAGWMSTTFYRSDEDPRELWMVAMFSDEEAYRTNAATAAQHAVYMMLRACLESDPEWHDVGEMVSLASSSARK